MLEDLTKDITGHEKGQPEGRPFHQCCDRRLLLHDTDHLNSICHFEAQEVDTGLVSAEVHALEVDTGQVA